LRKDTVPSLNKNTILLMFRRLTSVEVFISASSLVGKKWFYGEYGNKSEKSAEKHAGDKKNLANDKNKQSIFVISKLIF
jgi:hypothetical protein